jgi:serine/threonine-protein kinase RsbT
MATALQLPTPTEASVQVRYEADVAAAMRLVRHFAMATNFSPIDTCYLATVATELASNLWIHAGGGVLQVALLPNLPGIEIIASDQGPGIADIDLAMQDGYSTGNGLGCGLPGVKRLMDGIEIDSQPGQGTHIRVWKRRARGLD